jgi:hypothetical protein
MRILCIEILNANCLARPSNQLEGRRMKPQQVIVSIVIRSGTCVARFGAGNVVSDDGVAASTSNVTRRIRSKVLSGEIH